ncbi:growth factor receptor-bound protein 2a [Dunckerocampus dactyliophorus]|uniref:growth factor receptor-bound protein 2a n=1 Tax=Dunckerocampus dactyliophorus TaxID=161453 RepID=UPI0024052A5D|nr:growth factor receptor-bound protein 2a [Dunckerocampus dactyliophorus]
MEAIAIVDFKAVEEDQLSFCRGNILKVLKKDSNWCRAELNGIEGFVPSNYINLKPHKWFYETISEAEAEELLMKATSHEANFLIRESEVTKGDFELSVRSGNGVQHFKILRDSAGHYFIWVVKFQSLNQLVSYHYTSSVARDQLLLLRTVQDQSGHFEALYDFEPQEEGDLAFKKGDLVDVLDDSNNDWWKGVCNGKTGMFPSKYVTPQKN